MRNQSFWVPVPIKVGVYFQKGGFHNLLTKIGLEKKIFGMGDCSKWDKHFHKHLRTLCMQVRIALYSGPEDKRAEFVERLRYVYSQSIDTFCILPWKQVIRVLDYMMSGDWNTTADNSMAHLMLLLAYVKLKFPSVSNYREAFSLMEPGIYSDDHIFACPDTRAGRILSDFSNRQSFYTSCGFILKEEDDFVRTDGDWTDLTFLGAKAMKFGALWVPKYDLQRCWSSIVFDNYGGLKPYDYYSKLLSLMLLSTFHGRQRYNEIRDRLQKLVSFLDAEYGDEWFPRKRVSDVLLDIFGEDVHAPSDIPLLPNWEWAIKFWTGYEGVGLAHLPLRLVESEGTPPAFD